MSLPSDVWARATLEFTGAGVPNGAAVVFALAVVGVTDLNALAQDVRGAWLTSYLGTQSSGVTLTRTIVKQGPDETGPFGEFSGADNGGVAGAGAAPNMAYLIHKITASGGRRGRGRMYLPGVDEASIGSDGALTGAKVTSLNSAGVDFLTDMLAITEVTAVALEHQPAYSWVLENGQPRRVPVGVAPDPTVITAMTADPVAATQRRRMRG